MLPNQPEVNSLPPNIEIECCCVTSFLIRKKQTKRALGMYLVELYFIVWNFQYFLYKIQVFEEDFSIIGINKREITPHVWYK